MRTTILVATSFALYATAAFAQQVGDTVIVSHDNTPIRVNEKVLDEVSRGLNLKVGAVNGDWLWVSNEATGWINKKHVTTPTNAFDLFSEQIRQNPQDWYACFARGCVRLSQGDNDGAISDYNESIRLKPSHSSTYGNRAICWSNKRDFEKAIADSTEAIRLRPTACLYSNRASYRLRTSEFDMAIADATEAIRLAPQFSDAYYRRGVAWASKDEHDKAISDFSKAITIDPKDASAYRNRAFCWKNKADFSRAIADYRVSLALDPKNADALRRIAWLYATCNDDKYRNGHKAIEYGTTACELTGWRDYDKINTLAAAYAEAGDFEKAVECQKKVLALAPEENRAWYRYYLDLYASGKPYRDVPE